MKSEKRSVRLEKAMVFAALFVALAFVTVGCASAATHHVNPGESIQAVINNASDGDTIYVHAGTYIENVNVDKQLTLVGDEADKTIVQASNSNDHVFEVTADYVSISGFTMTGATRWAMAGIYLGSVDHCHIYDNNASNNYYGICLSGDYNMLTHNNANSNGLGGIHLIYSSNNTLTHNSAWDNLNGICLDSSNNNTLTSNIANSNTGYAGIHLSHSSNNTLTSNIASNNSIYGIYLDSSSNNTLTNNNGSISLHSSSNNMLTHNIASSIIHLDRSSNNTLTSNIGRISLCTRCNNNTLTSNIASNNTNAYGIYLHFSSNNVLTSNTASNNEDGIYLWESSNNTLTNNTANSNYRYGIMLYSSSNNVLTNNTVSNGSGILLSSLSNYNTLTSNTASNNSNGIYLESSSSSNVLTNNTANSNSDYGIYLRESCNCNVLTNNTANSNSLYGIWLDSSSNNTLTGNTANENHYGIWLGSSSNNTLTNNTANSNDDYGIYLVSSSSNLIYNNYFNNTNNAYDDGNNIWNITKTAGTNVIGGSYLGGNYWSDYAGTDTDGDGLGDTLLPYNSSGGITNGGDYLPLVEVAQKPIVSITTDKFIYTSSDTQTITIDIANPTKDSVTFQWYWGVPQYGIWVPVTSAPIPAGYEDTHDFSFTIPDWGSTPFGNGFYVQLLDERGEVLDADTACWAYSPGVEAMPAVEVDIAKEIKKTVEGVELSS